MKTIVKALGFVILTIPGMSFVEAGMIPSEIGNLRRISSPSKRLTFAALDPSV